MKFFVVFTENEKLCFVYTPMRASDVVTNVTKQNMNVMASMSSAKQVKHWRAKK